MVTATAMDMVTAVTQPKAERGLRGAGLPGAGAGRAFALRKSSTAGSGRVLTVLAFAMAAPQLSMAQMSNSSTSLVSEQGNGATSGAGVRIGSLGFRAQSRISVTQTWTDNLNLQERAPDKALITIVAPGISISSTSGRLRGTLDYALNGLVYTKSERENTVQHALTANANLEVLDRVMFVDMRASYGQQQSSAFGQQTSPENASRNPNSTDVASLMLAPVLRGRLGNYARVEAKVSATETNAKGSELGDSSIHELSLRADGIATGPLSWWSMGNTQRSHFKVGNSASKSSLTAGANYRVDVDFSMGASAGLERSNLQTGSNNQAGPTAGFNAQWTPTPRTSLQGDYQHHDYGDSHSLSLNHRFQRSSIRYSDNRSVAQGLDSKAGGQQSNYELYFFQFQSLYPDPAVRDAKVRQFLQESGLNANAPANSGFLSSGPSLQRRQELSFSWNGLRASATAMLNQSKNSRIGTQLPDQGDLAKSSMVLQRGASASFSYRLTPESSLSVALSEQQTRGDQANLSSTLRTANVNWTGRLGAKGSVNLGARHSKFDGSLPYRENAVFATLVHQF